MMSKLIIIQVNFCVMVGALAEVKPAAAAYIGVD